LGLDIAIFVTYTTQYNLVDYVFIRL